MLEARIRKFYPEILKKYYKNPKEFAISLQHVLDCSVQNQGCDGGYSYLVSKYYQDVNMVLKNCEGLNCQKKCQDPKLEDLDFGVTDFGYVGGAYGNCNERKIMEEVYKNVVKNLHYERLIPCGGCSGIGGSGNKDICMTCMGSGEHYTVRNLGFMHIREYAGPCGDCFGRGEKLDSFCNFCK